MEFITTVLLLKLSNQFIRNLQEHGVLAGPLCWSAFRLIPYLNSSVYDSYSEFKRVEVDVIKVA